jgi:hypothetical protein
MMNWDMGPLDPNLAMVHWDCTPKLEIITVRLAPNTPDAFDLIYGNLRFGISTNPLLTTTGDAIGLAAFAASGQQPAWHVP